VVSALAATNSTRASDDSIDAECRTGLDNPALTEMLEIKIDIAGVWDGYSSFFWVTRLIVKKDSEGPDQYRLTFEVRTDLLDRDYERTARFENGILTLDEPVSRLEFAGPTAPYSVLFAVRTDRGDFLVPSVTAGTVKTVDDLQPGLAYRRRTDR
jgi:hypothetical protein